MSASIISTGSLQLTSPGPSALGKVSVYDHVVSRYDMMKETPVRFDPFTGPIYDNKGNLQIAEGETATKDDLLSMM